MSRKLMDELQSGEYGSPLKRFHRDIMLDLVLAWGSLDGALTMLVAAFTGEELHEVADRLGKQKGSKKLLEIARILEDNDQTAKFATNFKKQKKLYEKHSKPRNRIAHAHCSGYLLSDDQFIVFAIGEREGKDQMAVEAIPVEQMKSATEYGRKLTAFATRITDRVLAVN